MSTNSLRQWLKLVRREAKQLRQTLDDELQTVLERNIPRPRKSLVRVPVSVKPGISLKNSNRFIHTSSQEYARDLQTANRALGNSAPRFASAGKRTVLGGFNGAYRAPKGVPRGLFTNWNMTTTRFTSGRAYSTSAIKITHDAVQNIAISLRCFYNLWDDIVPSKKGSTKNGLPLRTSNVGNKQLGAKDVSALRTMEVCRMIETHKQELALGEVSESETMGCFVEFKMPRLDMSNMPTVVFASDEALNKWRDELAACNQKLRKIEESVRTIYDNYGALPLEFGEKFVRFRFPNLTMLEAEVLMRDLGLTLGLVLPERYDTNCSTEEPLDDLSTAFCDAGGHCSEYSSVLSSSSPSETHFSEFSILSSQA
ncbi:LANO_0E02652g1_1 [Lachancea nothofagi CBS 11611]|uniref:LANO_0E02652g1_1 n=1 Tax=Lachancea nothofagi CBS 11611 TaxID=1266666 RepID=A0A1G4JQE1_9SACH|nr:LANO_0E02652g1_1 [Lachancea nothofagi CBS 11611]